ncbi:enamelin isoform X2 [Nerophis ophidion]|uniref:enamelin isoform X2 n=1 Tax=Nerophis ophidion TaxID=159077 RepID=UPI002ADFD967|nr:enamelin isoform X2 [Nerophis ophidion]
MERGVLVMILLAACSAAPVEQSPNQEVAAHAHEALRWMEMYRLYQQQGMVANPFLPAAAVPAEPAAAETEAAVDASPAQLATDAPAPAGTAPAPAQMAGEASEEETEEANPAPKSAAPLNSDEGEEAEETEVAEEEEGAVAGVPADPASAVHVPAEVNQDAGVDAPEAAAPPAAPVPK